MSIAWGSLVLLVVLLPGILFFVAQLLPEHFTRETEQRSALGQLAAALFVAVFVHGIAYALLSQWCGSHYPCISFSAFIATVDLEPANAAQISMVDGMLRRYSWWILLYFLVTCSAGALAGFGFGKAIAKYALRGFTKHPWIHKLRVDGFTYAYVLTKIAREDHYLMYKGFLDDFGLQQDGRFSYLVLLNAERLYLKLEEETIRTTQLKLHLPIGRGSESSSVGEGRNKKRRVRSYFMIAGAEVANVVFDSLAADAPEPLTFSEIRDLVVSVASELDEKVTAQQLAELEGASSDPGHESPWQWLLKKVRRPKSGGT